ncbi:hypothetical protein, partial ['Chrysanthemum coronarium' phytoplasma]
MDSVNADYKDSIKEINSFNKLTIYPSNPFKLDIHFDLVNSDNIIASQPYYLNQELDYKKDKKTYPNLDIKPFLLKDSFLRMPNANILEIKKRLDVLEIEESNQEQSSTASNDDKLHVSIDDLYEIKNDIISRLSPEDQNKIEAQFNESNYFINHIVKPKQKAIKDLLLSLPVYGTEERRQMMEAKTPQEKAQYIKDLIEEFTGATGSKTYFMKERKKIIELLRNSLVSNLSAPNIQANSFSPEQNQRLEEFKTTNPTYLNLKQQEKNILDDFEKKLQEFENTLNNITLSEPNK